MKRIFATFQQSLDVDYYKCGRLTKPIKTHDITKIASFGINDCEKRNLNKWLICPVNVIPTKRENDSLNDFFIDQMLNHESAIVDVGGTYKGKILLPTEISTIWYENTQSKVLYDTLRKICRKGTKNINGYFIGEEAYLQKEKYRFCTISESSPPEYDLKIQ